jgi:hypothetical protein
MTNTFMVLHRLRSEKSGHFSALTLPGAKSAEKVAGRFGLWRELPSPYAFSFASDS